jgi:hypothetical protein
MVADRLTRKVVVGNCSILIETTYCATLRSTVALLAAFVFCMIIYHSATIQS